MYSGYRRAFGTKDSAAENGAESFTSFGGEVLKQLVVSVAQINVDETTEGRVVEKLPFCHLVVEHLPVVVGGDMPDDVTVGRACLQDDVPRMAIASRTSCYLAECLEGTFVASEVGQVEHGVCVKYPDNGNIVEIESFGDHLGADKDVCLMVGEIADDVLVLLSCFGCVKIHAED